MAEGGTSSPTLKAAATTSTVTETTEREGPRILRLRSPEAKKKAVKWSSGTVDNEGMNKKKSKCCCIYKKPRIFGESSDESDDDHDCTNSCHGHKKKCYRHDEDNESGSPEDSVAPYAQREEAGMGIQDLLEYIEQVCSGAVNKQVDLLRVARSKPISDKSGARLSLVLDAETCLDRLYGGFFPDWVSGGEWNNTLHFLQSLLQACEANHIQLVFFFNGGLELQRIQEWHEKQLQISRKVSDIYRHIHTKGVPPPKVLWVPPICLTTVLRMILRHLRVTVSYSMDDHHQEVIAYCRENNFDGIVAQDAEYAIFDPPRLFSASALKLKFSGSVVSNEYILDEVAKTLDLHPKRFCVFGALLGNHILSEEDLRPFHDRLLCTLEATVRRERKSTDVINGVVNFVRKLNSVDDLNEVGLEVFGGSTGEKADLISRFKQCVQYYLNGTMEGFLKYLPKFLPATAGMPLLAGGYPAGVSREEEHMRAVSQVVQQQQLATAAARKTTATVPATSLLPTSPEVAPDVVVNDVAVNGHPEKEGGAEGGPLPTPSIVIDPPTKRPTGGSRTSSTATTPISAQATPATTPTGSSGIPKMGDPHKLSSLSSSSSSSDGYSPQRLSPDAPWPPTGVAPSSIKITPKSPIKEAGATGDAAMKSDRPVAPPEIIRIASERHQKGLMAPFIYQVLTQGEVKLNASFEDECYREFPPAVDFYRPVRQCMYGLLFNLASKEQETSQPVVIKEWLIRPDRPEAQPESVLAVPLDWDAPIPSIQRLWVGQHVEDKNRRLRAFLSCMGSDYSPLLLNTSYVPQHLLILCTVLRYMLLSKEQVLRRHELEAFLSQSVSPMLHARNSKHLLDLTVPSIGVRGVNLSSLFMSGVETAVVANDVCGVPVPWMMCCPWMFFDGKLFQYKLLKAEAGAQIIDLCEGQMELVMRVERMRQAILEDVKFEFAALRPFGDPSRSIGLMGLKPAGAVTGPPAPISPTRGPSAPRGTGRGRGALGRGRLLPVGAPGPGLEGGELQVAGVVTGQWAGQQHRATTPPGFPRRPYSMPQCLRSHRAVGRGAETMPPSGPLPLPGPRFMPEPSYEPRPRGRGQRRHGSGKSGRSRSASGRVEGAEAGPSLSMGRGCTVERLDGSGIFLASELRQSPPSHCGPENPESSYESLHKGPDSGIHVHPVVCEGE